jgi:hypothetical protein
MSHIDIIEHMVHDEEYLAKLVSDEENIENPAYGSETPGPSAPGPGPSDASEYGTDADDADADADDDDDDDEYYSGYEEEKEYCDTDIINVVNDTPVPPAPAPGPEESSEYEYDDEDDIGYEEEKTSECTYDTPVPPEQEDVLLDVVDIYSEQMESEDFEHQNITISIEEIKTPEPVLEKTPIIPKLVFIVPYRNREKQLVAFKTHMKYILEDYPKDDYEIYFIHQKDERIFNRGAMKNIGFLAIKDKYPENYKNITLVFNDVDTMPVKKNLFDYNTVKGVVKHFFGFTFTLGGIVSIKAGDFEMVNGFPNFWAWGYEDNLLQMRLESVGIKIDRSIFYKIGDKNIIQHNEETTREVNQGEYERYVRKTAEGIYSIRDLQYDIDAETGFVNVNWFLTDSNPNINQYRLHDLKEGPRPYDTKFGLMYNNRRMRGGAQMKMLL